MRSLILLASICSAIPIFAQPDVSQAFIAGAGYSYPVPLSVAPGQVLTLLVEGVTTQLTAPVRASGNSLPATLAGISVTYHQGDDQAAPILEVRPISTCLGIPPPSGSTCSTILAVTAQMPFNMLTVCPVCGRIDIPASLSVAVDGVAGPTISVQPLTNRVHFLTTCDVLLGASQRIYVTPLPCPAVVTHADGKLVSAANPAKDSEQIVAYAIGLGQTDPPLTAGEPAAAAAPTLTVFAIDFNYRPNAGATEPAGPSFPGTGTAFPTPAFTGATAGFFGLYQINFVVPPPPADLVSCVDATGIIPFTNTVQSNLTVSVGSAFSFDGIGICVAPVK